MVITAISEGTPAAAAELRPGDVIVEFGNDPVRSIDDLHRLLTEERIGELVPIKILRRGELRRVLVTPAEICNGVWHLTWGFAAKLHLARSMTPQFPHLLIRQRNQRIRLRRSPRRQHARHHGHEISMAATAATTIGSIAPVS